MRSPAPPRPARIRALVCAAPLIPLGIALGSPSWLDGFWPLATEQLWLLAAAAGIAAAVAGAWNAAQVDHRYLTASSRSPVWALVVLVEPAVTTTLLIGAVGAAGILHGLYRDTVGGAPPWWLLISTILWLLASATAGCAVGTWLYRKPQLAGVAAFVGSVSLLVLAHRPVQTVLAPMVLFSWEGRDDFVRFVPNTAALAGSWAVAVVIMLWAGWSMLYHGNLGPRALTAVVAVAAMVLLSGVTARGEFDTGRLSARPVTDELVCTSATEGVQLCTWPEHQADIEALDPTWPKVVGYLRDIGVEVPAGTIVSKGLENATAKEPLAIIDFVYDPDVTSYNAIETVLRHALGEDTIRSCTTTDGPVDFSALPAFGFIAKQLYFPDSNPVNIGVTNQERIIGWLAAHDEAEILDQLRDFYAELTVCGPDDQPELPW